MGTDGDNLKRIKVSFRLAAELVHECEQEAETLQLPLSHILRDRFSNKNSTHSTFDTSKIIQSLQNIENKFDHFQSTYFKEASSLSSDNPLVLEILFLLREFLFERNAQILKKVDEKLEKRFGKERQKII